MNRLFIDPSIRSMGVAYWNEVDWRYECSPTITTLIKTVGHGKWDIRAWKACNKLFDFLRENDLTPDKIYCELPTTTFSVFSGSTAIANDSITKLATLFGMLSSSARSEGMKFVPVPIALWKGQLPKNVVIQRVKSFLGEKDCKNFKADIWDAVGMGLYWMGRL